MINMENREEMHIKQMNAEENYMTTPISVLSYITALEEQNKQLLDEIERLKSELKERTSLAMDYVNQIYQLQFELKAADSVNEQLQFQYNELEKAMYKLTISNDNN